MVLYASLGSFDLNNSLPSIEENDYSINVAGIAAYLSNKLHYYFHTKPLNSPCTYPIYCMVNYKELKQALLD